VDGEARAGKSHEESIEYMKSPITKSQTPNKFQYPNASYPNKIWFGYCFIWLLDIIWLLRFGVWLF
jgi:hypothetical protein